MIRLRVFPSKTIIKQGVEKMGNEINREVLLAEIAREAGIDEKPLIEKYRELVESGVSPDEAFDKLEVELALWSSVERHWEKIAQTLRLARIYLEAGYDLRKALQPRGVERRLSWPALRILYSRYLLRHKGRVGETPDMLMRRVATYVALPEFKYGKYNEMWNIYYSLLSNLRFLPNSPTLMNAGTRYPQLAACFVVPLEDSMDGILDALRVSAWIFKSGAGAGFDFSVLRPRGSPIEGTGGVSSGPVSFMRLFDTIADVVKEGGKRRAAMMAVSMTGTRTSSSS
jgi:ribonucleoside-diphosphate reductase alpha chain